MFHRQPDSIEAHLTLVFCPLAVARHLQRTGVSIKKIFQALKPLHTVTIGINGHELIAPPRSGPMPRPSSTTYKTAAEATH